MNHTMSTCLNKALDMADNLFPVDCISILEEEYKAPRLENMKPITIFNKVKMMMLTVNVEIDCDGEIVDAVNSYIGEL